jgi:hypothetical protein
MQPAAAMEIPPTIRKAPRSVMRAEPG